MGAKSGTKAAVTRSSRDGLHRGTYDYWLIFCRSENMPPSTMLERTPDRSLGMLAEMKGCPQDPEWHPEGDVWVHSGQVCDLMHRILQVEELSGTERVISMMAALLHDCGKPDTTIRRRIDGISRILSPNHASVGAKKARRWMEEVGFPAEIIAPVEALVRCHMARLALNSTCTYDSVFGLAREVRPSNLYHLGLLMTADTGGRCVNWDDLRIPEVPKVERMVEIATDCNILHGL